LDGNVFLAQNTCKFGNDGSGYIGGNTQDNAVIA
jgi:hypothetical protein